MNLTKTYCLSALPSNAVSINTVLFPQQRHYSSSKICINTQSLWKTHISISMMQVWVCVCLWFWMSTVYYEPLSEVPSPPDISFAVYMEKFLTVQSISNLFISVYLWTIPWAADVTLSGLLWCIWSPKRFKSNGPFFYGWDHGTCQLLFEEKSIAWLPPCLYMISHIASLNNQYFV